MMLTKNTSKIFGIGLSRTGTTSLAHALAELEYKVKHFPTLHYSSASLLGIAEEDLLQYDAFMDTPVIPFYQDLDKRFAGAKFIYTIRGIEQWVDSCRHYKRFHYPIDRVSTSTQLLRQHIYKGIQFDELRFRSAYYRHHEEVLHYFKKRQQDLLIINICDGEGWDKLCAFLEKEIPSTAFPHANRRGLLIH